MFEEFSPMKNIMFQLMDKEGKIVNSKWMPKLDDEEILRAYKFMHFARTADLMAVSYQRQGRMYTYPPNLGQEAIGTAAGFLMEKKDWLVPAFRELSAWLLKGSTLRDFFLYWRGNERGSMFSDAPRFLPSTVPIASQIPHAVGIGFAMKVQKDKGIVFTFVGDGGTSQGDFHEALNFAGVWKVPVICIIQNNQYAISVPVKNQTGSRSLAIKAEAYGIRGIQVDGNDFLGMYAVIDEAKKKVRNGDGPILIEAVTFRKGAHTTSDDPTLYRTKEEEDYWEDRDPIKRLRQYLVGQKRWKETDDEPLIEGYKREVEQQFVQSENLPATRLEETFQYHYQDIPDDLKKQQADYELFLKWREARK